MTELNIYTGSTLTVNDVEQDALVEFLEKGRPRSLSIRISISRTTSKYLDMILDNIGKEYDNRIVIIQDSDRNFGMLVVEEVDTFSSFQKKVMNTKVFRLLQFVNAYDLATLKSTITMESPSFLIMNNYTWTVLNQQDDSNIDEYDTMGNKAYYHSYYKTPVALSELLDNNVIKVVTG